MIKIGIIDYGVGNVRSMTNAFNHFACEVVLTNDEQTILQCDGIVLPGVGAFKHGIEKLQNKNLDKILKNYIKTSKPLLGICLGMQMLFESSSEFGDTKGLSFIKGKVKKLPAQRNIKLPHIAWSSLILNSNLSLDGTILNNIDLPSDFYHVHSYYAEPQDSKSILTYSMYNDFKFCSTVNYKNIFGCQYHPEKSGNDGLKIIKNFLDLANNK